MNRRFLLSALGVMATGLLLPGLPAFGTLISDASLEEQLAQLERISGGRLGVCLQDGKGRVMASHRAHERFPFCSTCKVMVAGAVLKRADEEANMPGKSDGPGLLDKIIQYDKEELVAHSPVTERKTAMSVATLCKAALQNSDNTALNLLLGLLGGPESVNAFAKSIGDDVFRLDRWETELNTALPGDPRDTTTPAAMASSLQTLVLGNVLSPSHKELLLQWLKGSTTGKKRLRAGLPEKWELAGKTGSGDYGTTNEVAVLFPPQSAPLTLAVYYTAQEKDAPMREDVLADVARIVLTPKS